MSIEAELLRSSLSLEWGGARAPLRLIQATRRGEALLGGHDQRVERARDRLRRAGLALRALEDPDVVAQVRAAREAAVGSQHLPLGVALDAAEGPLVLVAVGRRVVAHPGPAADPRARRAAVVRGAVHAVAHHHGGQSAELPGRFHAVGIHREPAADLHGDVRAVEGGDRGLGDGRGGIRGRDGHGRQGEREGGDHGRVRGRDGDHRRVGRLSVVRRRVRRRGHVVRRHPAVGLGVVGRVRRRIGLRVGGGVAEDEREPAAGPRGIHEAAIGAPGVHHAVVAAVVPQAVAVAVPGGAAAEVRHLDVDHRGGDRGHGDLRGLHGHGRDRRLRHGDVGSDGDVGRRGVLAPRAEVDAEGDHEDGHDGTVHGLLLMRSQLLHWRVVFSQPKPASDVHTNSAEASLRAGNSLK